MSGRSRRWAAFAERRQFQRQPGGRPWLLQRENARARKTRGRWLPPPTAIAAPCAARCRRMRSARRSLPAISAAGARTRWTRTIGPRPGRREDGNGQHRETATMTRILHIRQFFADMLSAADLWLISGGVAV